MCKKVNKEELQEKQMFNELFFNKIMLHCELVNFGKVSYYMICIDDIDNILKEIYKTYDIRLIKR